MPRKKVNPRPHRHAGTYYPERCTFAVPAGTRERIVRAAERKGITPAEWQRAALRRALDGAERRESTESAESAA